MLDMDHFIHMLKFKPEEGKITFRDNRMLLFNANALCLLREELIHTLGWEIAKGVLTRFGYRCGFNDVISVRNMFDIQNDSQWMLAGTLMHALEGSVKVITDELKFDRDAGTFLMKGQWLNTYEADQQIALYGEGVEAACWTIAGYASGFGTGFMGREVLCIETMCRGKGDPYCAWEMRNVEAWGEEALRFMEELKPKAVVKSMENMLADERRMVEQWRALSQASVEITSNIAYKSRFRSFASYARTLMFAEHSLIAVNNENTSGMEIYRICEKGEWKKTSYEPKGVIATLVSHGQAVNLTDSDIKGEHFLPPGVLNLLGVPLKASNRIIGGIIVANKKDGTAFNQNDLDLLQILAGQAAIAIENSRLFERTDEKLQQKVAQLNKTNIMLSTQNAMVKKSAAIHSQLTDLVLAGKGIGAITDSLAQIVSNPVIVEDISFKLIAQAGSNFNGELETYYISAQEVFTRQEWKDEGEVLRNQRHMVKIPMGRIDKQKGYQYLVPIVAGQDILGYVSCFEKNKKLEELDLMALEHAGTVYALELLQQKVAFETEQRIKEDFIGELISGTYQSEEQVIKQGKKLGFNLKTGYMVTLLDVEHKEAGMANTETMHHLLGLFTQGMRAYSPHSMVASKKKQILILLSLPKKGKDLDNFDDLARYLKDVILKTAPLLYWRLAGGTVCYQVPDFCRSYEEASFTLEFMRNMNRQNTGMLYDQLRIFGMLDINKKTFTEFISKVIGPLLEYDAQHNSQLVETLKLYYSNNGNVQQAARRGYLNSSTLKYRLKRIQEIAGIDLVDPDISLQVQLALKLLT